MSTPTTPIRAINTAEKIVNSFYMGVKPIDLADAIMTEQGVKISQISDDSKAHRLMVRVTVGYLRSIADELAGLHDAMDLIGTPDAHTDGGEGGATPELGGSNHGAALPRPKGVVCLNPGEGIGFYTDTCMLTAEPVPDQASIIDTIENELATEDAANNIPLALIGNRGYTTTIAADSKFPRV